MKKCAATCRLIQAGPSQQFPEVLVNYAGNNTDPE